MVQIQKQDELVRLEVRVVLGVEVVAEFVVISVLVDQAVVVQRYSF